MTRTMDRWLTRSALIACLALLGTLGAMTSAAIAGPSTACCKFTAAKLLQGWKYVADATAPPGYAKDSLGIVHLRGTIVGKGNHVENHPAFDLPQALAPSYEMRVLVAVPGYPGVPPDVNGLMILPAGQVTPIGENMGGNAQSLDGISFVAGSAGKIKFTNATLENGWQYGGPDSAPPSYAIDSRGVVHLRGGLVAGSSDTPAFMLPAALTPSHTMWLPIYETNSNGNDEESLEINSDGEVIPIGTAEGSVGNYSSLDGVSFVAHGSDIKFRAAKLLNGFQDGGYRSASPGYAKDALGIVHLHGSLSGQNSGHVAFYLPKALRPRHQLNFPIYTYDAEDGGLEITKSGAVIPRGNSEVVRGYASLDGISFVAGQ
jgi:hypothetical protein